MKKRQWRIMRHGGEEPGWTCELPSGHLSDRQVRGLLARLAARHLTADEVVAASLGSRARHRRSLLDVRFNHGGRYGFFTSGDPHYVASLWDTERPAKPTLV